MRHAVLTVTVALACSACSNPHHRVERRAACGFRGDPRGRQRFERDVYGPADQLPHHLTIGSAQKTQWSTVFRTNGTVDWDNEHTTQAITQVSGPISRLAVDAGARVKARRSPAVRRKRDVATRLRAIASQKPLRPRAANLARSKDLLSHKALTARFRVGRGRLQRRRHRFADVSASAEDFWRHGGGDHRSHGAERRIRQSWSCDLRSRDCRPATGCRDSSSSGHDGSVVVSKHLDGLCGTCSDKDLALVHVGDKVDERNASIPEAFHGVVSYIGDLIDPATRTTPVRVVTQNPNRLLKKDLYVDLVIHDKATREVIAVPTTAVLYDEQNFPFVYVQVETGKFAQRHVNSATSRTTAPRCWTASKRANPSSPRAVCSCNSQTLINSDAMINRLVSFALSQRFIVIVAMVGLAVWGIVSFKNLPIDAYPDLSPPRVQIVTQWPGHAAEEIERLITIPLEVEMNGIPKLDALRSISLYGLSSVTMNFEYDTDPYFARQQAFERIPTPRCQQSRRACAAVQPERADLPGMRSVPWIVQARALAILEDATKVSGHPGSRRRLRPWR